MQNKPSKPKNEKSTARKTRPTLVEKIAMLEEIYARVSRCVFVLTAVSWSINQSINQSNDQSSNQSINQSIEWSINQSIKLSLNEKRLKFELCWRTSYLDRDQVTWLTTYGSVDCIAESLAVKYYSVPRVHCAGTVTFYSPTVDAFQRQPDKTQTARFKEPSKMAGRVFEGPKHDFTHHAEGTHGQTREISRHFVPKMRKNGL